MRKLFERDISSIYMVLLPGFVFVCGIMLSGCGSDKEPKGSVRGIISYNGSPLTEGLVNIYSDSKSVVGTTEIDSAGTFKFDNMIAAGDYRVYISPPPPPAPPEPGQSPIKIPKPQKIPQKYRSADKTDLKITIKEGDNDIPIQLTD